MARIIAKETLTPVTKLFEVEAPLVARNAQPGQFVILRVHPEGERIPVTISDYDPEAGTLTIVVQEVGKTTKLIGALEPGDSILDLVGPMGQPAPLPENSRVVLVGGGFGIAAIYPLARQLQQRGKEVHSIVGARTAGLLLFEDRLADVSDALYVCTDDGSRGTKGFVTMELERLLSNGRVFDAAYAVGPLPMMRAVAEVTRGPGVPTWVSLDPIMLDGTGMCGACRVSVGGVLRFACLDGPFFDAHQVDFDEAQQRAHMYASEQKAALQTLEGVEVR